MNSTASTRRTAGLLLCAAASCLALTACSKGEESDDDATTPAAADANATAPATPATGPAPAATDTATVSGATLAQFTGDAAKGKTDFATCMACHSIDEGVNKIGPSLHGVVGRKAGTIAGFTYSAANKDSGITWTPDKLFQYLENPQRVVPGTKMTFTGVPEPQKRADIIAYLQENSK